MSLQTSPVGKIWNLVRQEKKEITAIYFYAILNGLIQLSLPLGVQAIIGFVLGGAISASLILLITLVVLGVLFTGLMQINNMRIIEKIQQKIFVRYAISFSERIPRIDLKKADNFYLPELVNRFFEIPVLQKGISKLLLDIPTASIQILFGLLLLSFYHPVFIFFGLFLLLLLGVILYYTGNAGLQSSLEESTHKYAVASWLEELARVVKSFKFSKGSQLHLKNADSKTTNYLSARIRHFGILLLQYKTLVGFKTIITAAMLIVGALLLVRQQINIGQFIAAEIIIITVINSIEKLIINLDSVYDVLTSVEKISKLTENPLEVSGKQALSPTGEGFEVELQNVSFCYDNEHEVLRDISFHIAPGDKVCITGKDGSGKTTLLKLLTGSYMDFKGSILINKIPIGNYDIDALRSQTGVLLNQQDIFQGTLWQNITMGNDDTDINSVIELIEKAGLRSFISSLKNGFDTVLDATGRKLPTNVIHKILLVRALVNHPRLVLLEEPFLGLEDEQKKQIKDFLFNQLKNTTVIIVVREAQHLNEYNKMIHLHKSGYEVIVNQ